MKSHAAQKHLWGRKRGNARLSRIHITGLDFPLEIDPETEKISRWTEIRLDLMQRSRAFIALGKRISQALDHQNPTEESLNSSIISLGLQMAQHPLNPDDAAIAAPIVHAHSGALHGPASSVDPFGQESLLKSTLSFDDDMEVLDFTWK
jgi:hypothetical protein